MTHTKEYIARCKLISDNKELPDSTKWHEWDVAWCTLYDKVCIVVNIFEGEYDYEGDPQIVVKFEDGTYSTMRWCNLFLIGGDRFTNALVEWLYEKGWQLVRGLETFPPDGMRQAESWYLVDNIFSDGNCNLIGYKKNMTHIHALVEAVCKLQAHNHTQCFGQKEVGIGIGIRAVLSDVRQMVCESCKFCKKEITMEKTMRCDNPNIMIWRFPLDDVDKLSCNYWERKE